MVDSDIALLIVLLLVVVAYLLFRVKKQDTVQGKIKKRFNQEGGIVNDPKLLAMVGPEPQVVQFAIMLDTTPSMHKALEACKDNLVALVKRIEDMGKEYHMLFKVEVAFMSYKDMAVNGSRDFPGHLDHVDFTEDTDEVLTVIKKQVCSSPSNDAPEDIAGALECGIERLSWKDKARKVLFLICDAPCHGREYHPEHWKPSDTSHGHLENFPEDGKKIPGILKQLVEQKVSILVSSMKDDTKVMQEKFRAYYKNQPGVIYEDVDLMKGMELFTEQAAGAMKSVLQNTMSSADKQKYKQMMTKMKLGAMNGVRQRPVDK